MANLVLKVISRLTRIGFISAACITVAGLLRDNAFESGLGCFILFVLECSSSCNIPKKHMVQKNKTSHDENECYIKSGYIQHHTKISILSKQVD